MQGATPEDRTVAKLEAGGVSAMLAERKQVGKWLDGPRNSKLITRRL